MTMRPDNGSGQLPNWVIAAAAWLFIFSAVLAALWVWF